MKLLRILFSVLLLLFLVCVIAISCLMIFIDPNKLKPVIIAEVMQKTGYQLVIEDKLSWSFYPKFGIKAAHMQLKNPIEAIAFVDLYDVSIGTDLMQLLKGTKKLQGDVYIKQVKYMNVHAQSAHIGLHWQDSILTLQPLTAYLYDGTMEGIVHSRELSEVPLWDWNVQFKKIQLKPLLQDINSAPAKLNLSGIGQVRFQGQTRGINRSQVLSNLNGICHFSARDGVLDGVDFNYFIQSADALINKQPLNKLINTNQTAFDSLIGSAEIKNGVAETDNLFVVSSAFSTKASGRLDLINQTMNLQLQIIPLHAEKVKWAIPLLISGDLHSPTIRLDMLKLQAMITQEELEKIKNKVQEKVKELPQKVDHFLKKLMNE